MFLFVGKILGIGFAFFVGWLAITKPYELLGFHGTPRQIAKHIRHSKLVGLLIMTCGAIMLIFLICQLIAGR